MDDTSSWIETMSYDEGNTTTDDDDSEILPFVHSVVIAVLYITISIVGIVGNTLVIAGVAATPKLRTATNILIVNLAVADLLTCLVLPFQTAGVLSPPYEFPLPDKVCASASALMYLCFTCSAVTLMLISIIRCYVITKSLRGFKGLHTPRNLFILATSAWLLAAAFIFIPAYAFGLAEFWYYPTYKQCLVRDTEQSEIYHVFLGALITFHLAVIMICYAKIFLFVRHQHKYFRSVSVTSATSATSTCNYSLNGRELKVTINLFIIIVAFVVCTLPTAITFFIPGAAAIGAYATAVMFFNNCINPILYAFKHPVFKVMAKNLFRSIMWHLHCRRRKNEERRVSTISTLNPAFSDVLI